MSSPSVHPSDTVEAEWVLSSHPIHAGGLIVEHQIQPSGECEASSGLTHNVLVFELGYVPRQVSRIGEYDYDGPLDTGEQDITLADLADIAGMSQCYFVSLFKQSLLITPWQYVMQQRVERAKSLLRQRDYAIT